MECPAQILFFVTRTLFTKNNWQIQFWNAPQTSQNDINQIENLDGKSDYQQWLNEKLNYIWTV